MTTHACPADGAATMPCCGRTPLEVPMSEGITVDATLVTCAPRDTVGIAGYTEPEWLRAARGVADVHHLAEASRNTLTLGQLTARLTGVPDDVPVEFRGSGLDGLTPGRFIAWRGVYADLALEPKDPEGPPTLAGDLLARCRLADGALFQGYKGGDYRMDVRTPVWVDFHGEVHHWGIADVRPLLRDGRIIKVRIVARDLTQAAQS